MVDVRACNITYLPYLLSQMKEVNFAQYFVEIGY